jgi:tight adherence protein B
VGRLVATLSAEGRMSANVLIALPVLIAVVLAVISPGYLTAFLTTPLGWAMIAGGLVLFAIGIVWLRAVVRVRF